MNRKAVIVSILVLWSAMAFAAVLPAVSAFPVRAEIVVTLFYVGDDVLCDQNWATATCWALTSGGVGAAGPPSSVNNVIFDSNSGTFNAVAITAPATAQDIRWDSSNGPMSEIDVFSTLTTRSIFNDRDIGPTTILIDTSPAEMRFAGTMAGNPLGLISISPMDLSGLTTYNGLNSTASVSYIGFERTDASGGPTIYCSPGCVDNGGPNTNIVFGPAPSPPSPTGVCTLQNVGGIPLLTLFVVFLGIGVLLAIFAYLIGFGEYGRNARSSMTGLQFGPTGWITVVIGIIVVLIVAITAIRNITC